MSAKQERRRLAALVRDMERADRERNRAHRRTATLTPQPARTWLAHLGVPATYADKYASAFSRGVTPTLISTTKIKPKKDSRKSERVVEVKLYSFATVVARLAGTALYNAYRPKNNPEAAAEFARAAALTQGV